MFANIYPNAMSDTGSNQSNRVQGESLVSSKPKLQLILLY